MSPSPLYERVESVLAAGIADGSLSPETQLPPEDGLIERFKVSRTTVRKAIQNLVERGLVEVRRGKGTFVTQPRITQELTELTGFVEDMQALGRKPTARFCGFWSVRPSPVSPGMVSLVIWHVFNGLPEFGHSLTVQVCVPLCGTQGVTQEGRCFCPLKRSQLAGQLTQ